MSLIDFRVKNAEYGNSVISASPSSWSSTFRAASGGDASVFWHSSLQQSVHRVIKRAVVSQPCLEIFAICL